MGINPWESTQATFVESDVSKRRSLQRVEQPEFFADTQQVFDYRAFILCTFPPARKRNRRYWHM